MTIIERKEHVVFEPTYNEKGNKTRDYLKYQKCQEVGIKFAQHLFESYLKSNIPTSPYPENVGELATASVFANYAYDKKIAELEKIAADACELEWNNLTIELKKY